MKDKKAEFEKSFSGYHKDAPAHLKKESDKLKKERTTSDGHMVVRREALVKGKKEMVKGYKDKETGLVHPSKEAYNDRYVPKPKSESYKEFKRKSPELKEARKGYNEQMKADTGKTKRGAFAIK